LRQDGLLEHNSPFVSNVESVDCFEMSRPAFTSIDTNE
jgi:hypothetical protein